jgi:DNA-3-methyladenine glycosylase II
MNYAERSAALTSIWGVGQWTADMMCMFYFGEHDVWPDGDVGARKTLERLTNRRRSTIRTAQLFAPHRSYLALYMWAHADARPE